MYQQSYLGMPHIRIVQCPSVASSNWGILISLQHGSLLTEHPVFPGHMELRDVFLHLRARLLFVVYFNINSLLGRTLYEG